MTFVHSALFVAVGGVDEVFSDLQPFMYKPIERVILPVENVFVEVVPPKVEVSPKISKVEVSPKKPIPPKVETKRAPPSLFFSNKEDTLFWAIYIQVYGYAAYLDIGVKYKNVEMEEKQKMVIHIKANAASYKTATNYKLTGVEIQEIMSDLMTNRKTSLLTVYAMAIYYKLSIVLIKDILYYDYSVHGTEESVEIYFKHGKYGLYIVDENVPAFDKTAAFRLESVHKPLRGVGSYKVAQLEEIFDKVVKPGLLNTEDLSMFTKMKKGDLYEAIVKRCVW